MVIMTVSGLTPVYQVQEVLALDPSHPQGRSRLTLYPWKLQREDVEGLRRAGFDDGQILDINQITPYYAFVNRLADGLGVELE